MIYVVYQETSKGIPIRYLRAFISKTRMKKFFDNASKDKEHYYNFFTVGFDGRED